MPAEGPGGAFSVIATKVAVHGQPAVELNHGGIAAKSAQVAPAAPSEAAAAAARNIAVGEEFVIRMRGLHSVPSSLLPGGAAAGDRLWIEAADNTLANAAEALTTGVLNAGFSKFGVIDSIDTTAGLAWINLSERGSF